MSNFRFKFKDVRNRVFVHVYNHVDAPAAPPRGRSEELQDAGAARLRLPQPWISPSEHDVAAFSGGAQPSSPHRVVMSWTGGSRERERQRQRDRERETERERAPPPPPSAAAPPSAPPSSAAAAPSRRRNQAVSPQRPSLSLSLSPSPPPRLPPSSPDAHTSGPEPLEAAGFRDASVSPPVLPEMRIRRRRAPGWRYIKTRYSPSRSHQKRKTTAAALRSNTPETQRQRERRSRGFGHTVCLLSTVADPPL